MTTTCQTIIDRARSLSPLNVSLTQDRVELLSRIRNDQQELFTQIAGRSTDYFQTTAALVSSSGASGRAFDLSALSPRVERVLLVTLSDGRTLNRVDITDQDGEFTPRYVQRGRSLVELSNEWKATTGTVAATLTYVYGMTDIDPNGAATQLVSVPDEWIDLLADPLGLHFFQKDPGRDEAEYQRLAAHVGVWPDAKSPLGSGRRGAFLAYLEQFGGDQLIRRFDR